jgi:hypothetical protein
MTQEKRVTNNINIADARIGFRNFAGKGGQFNPEGNRNFVVFLDNVEQALELEEEGWNVKWLDPKNEDDEKQPYLSVAVSFDPYPPKIVLVNPNKTTSLMTAANINILDWADILRVDLTLNPYNWNVRGKTGVKAYLKTMYVTIQPDPWESKYDFENAPDSAQNILCEPGYELIDGTCQRIED